MPGWYEVPEIPASLKVEVPSEDHEFYDLMFSINELVQADPDYVHAERQALGVVDELTQEEALRERLERTSLHYRFPLSSVTIDTLMDRVQPNGFMVGEAQQETFDAAWEANQMEVWEPKLRRDTFLYGEAYALTWPDDTDNPEDQDVIDSKVTINILSPRETRAIYDENNLRRCKYVLRRYMQGKRWHAELHYRDRIEFFRVTKDKSKGNTINQWERYSPEGVEGGEIAVNPWNEIAIKHYRTDLPYGSPVHLQGYGAQNAIAKLLVTEICTIEEQGWPSRYGLVATGQELEAVNDVPDVWEDSDQSDVAGRATRRSQFRSRPGYIQFLQGLSSAGQFEAADPKVFNEPVELFVSILSVVTRTPLYAFKPGGEQPSGRARQIADAPLESRKKSMQALLRGSYRDTITLMMRMLGMEVTEFDIAWQPTVMATDSDDWSVVQQKIDAGVPFDIAMVEAGHAPDVVESWIEEMQKFSTQESIALLQGIAEACSKLGGVSAISAEQVHAIIVQLCGELGITVGAFEEPEVPPMLDPNAPPGATPVAANERNESEGTDGSNTANLGS